MLKRYEAYGWHTQTVTDGNDNLGGIAAAVAAAQAETGKPSIIKIRYDSQRTGGAPLSQWPALT